MFDNADARRATGDAIERVIAQMRNLLVMTRIPKYSATPVTEVQSQDQVASRIAGALPELLRERGFLLVQLPTVRPDDFGCPSVRVFLSDRPWADGEVYARPIVWSGRACRLGCCCRTHQRSPRLCSRFISRRDDRMSTGRAVTCRIAERGEMSW